MLEIAGKNVPNWPIAVFVFLTLVSALQVDCSPAGCFGGWKRDYVRFPVLFQCLAQWTEHSPWFIVSLLWDHWKTLGRRQRSADGCILSSLETPLQTCPCLETQKVSRPCTFLTISQDQNVNYKALPFTPFWFLHRSFFASFTAWGSSSHFLILNVAAFALIGLNETRRMRWRNEKLICQHSFRTYFHK